MHKGWRSAVCVGLLAAVGAVVVAGSVGSPCGAITGPVAGVLDVKGRVLLVDLEAGRVVRTVKLRSSAWDIAADPGRRRFVTAQGGGVGADADDKVGVVDVRRGGRPGYVTLPAPNPLGVEVTGPGRVLVDNGFMDGEGAFVFVVDTDEMTVVREGRISDNNEPVVVLNGVGWSSGVDVATGARSLRRVDVDSLECSAAVETGDYAMPRVAGLGAAFGWLSSDAGQGSIARFDAKTGAVEATTSVGLEDGCGSMAFVCGRLVAADFAGSDLDWPGSRLFVMGPDTLQLERIILVAGGPCDVQAWGDRLVVGDFKNRELLVIDPVDGGVQKRIRLPGMSGLPFRVAVMEQ